MRSVRALGVQEMQQRQDGREAEERVARIDTESARQAAEDALQLRDVFLRTLAHDLKTPLTSLAWHAELLHRRLQEGDLEPAAMEEDLQAISLGAAEAIAAIDELHDLTRMSQGAPVALHTEPVDVVALARRIVDVHPHSGRRQVAFDSDTPVLVVEADSSRLARVLQNLLDNAVKYSSPDQPVIVSVQQEEIDGVAWATLRVRDSGIGIPSADLQHVFELYYRGGNVDSISGQGLGLANVHRLVRQHGGRVDVDSELGVGSMFTIRLPLVQDGGLGERRTRNGHIRRENF